MLLFTLHLPLTFEDYWLGWSAKEKRKTKNKKES